MKQRNKLTVSDTSKSDPESESCIIRDITSCMESLAAIVLTGALLHLISR